MFENLKLLRNWYKLARPNKKYWAISIMGVILAYTCLIIAPIFTAKVVISITAGDYVNTAIYLTVVFALLALRNMFWHINYAIFNKLIGSIYGRINGLFVDKMLKATPNNFRHTSKEKLLNIVHTDVYNLSEIADRCAVCIGRIVMLIATIIIIFFINPWVGLIVVMADILNFFLLNALENRRAKFVKKIREDHDKQYKKFGEIIDTRNTINELSLNRRLEKNYKNYLDGYIYDLGRKTRADSSITNGFFVFYNFLIFLLTLGMVFLVSNGQLSVEMYFIIVPYIANGIETTNLVFEFIPYVKNSGIYCSRVKTVLNFTEKKNIPVGDIDNDDVIGYMDFDNVSYNSNDDGDPSLKDITLRIKGLKTTLIMGPKNSGKRTIFHLMHRNIKPQTGEISIDGLNIFEYSTRIFNKNFNYLSTRPTFFNGSILHNLKMIDNNMTHISNACRQVGIMQYINALPQQMHTNILSLPYEKQYLLGLARVLLTKAEIIALYEIPSDFSKEEQKNLKTILNSLRGKRTLIIFSASSLYASIADKIVTIDKGRIKDIELTNHKFLGWEKNDL